jgi:hypothetical protein
MTFMGKFLLLISSAFLMIFVSFKLEDFSSLNCQMDIKQSFNTGKEKDNSQQTDKSGTKNIHLIHPQNSCEIRE